MLSEPRNRVLAVTNSAYNGVDFVEVTSPTTLVVHFLNKVSLETPTPVATVSGGDSVTSIPVAAIAAADWGTDPQNRPTLTLTTAVTGDFSDYTLTIASPLL